MPLSDRDRELLRQMEASLAESDPRLQSQMEGYSTSKNAKKIIGGLGLVFVGISLTLAAVIIKLPAIGLVGFLVALLGVGLTQSFFHAFTRGFISGSSTNLNEAKGSRKSFAQRLEERWERRNLGF